MSPLTTKKKRGGGGNVLTMLKGGGGGRVGDGGKCFGFCHFIDPLPVINERSLKNHTQ